jgi:hypothetical protein
MKTKFFTGNIENNGFETNKMDVNEMRAIEGGVSLHILRNPDGTFEFIVTANN